MLVILNLLLFVVLLTTFLKKNIIENFIIALLLFFSIVVVSTEVFSLFHSLNFPTLLTFWGLFTLFISFFFIKMKEIKINLKKNLQYLICIYKKFKKREKLLLFIILFFLISLLLQGLLYPTNNWDSLTYHMSRIMYWVGNESVSYFPTHILRHLYQPPFTEYLIMNINLLNGNDYLSNSVQWLFLVFSILPLWLILSFFKVSRFLKLTGVFVLITIPSLELQASTTKNDIVCGFFILTTLYFAIKSYYNSNIKYFTLLGISIGLGILTKGTAYLFIFPILLLLLLFIIHKILRTKETKIILYGLLTISVLITINIGHYYRNYQINKNILNIDETEAKMYSNEKMNAKFLASNIVKNIGLHLGYPIYQESDKLIKNLHNEFKIDINNPETNYSGMNYQVSQDLITHEDGVCNTTHIILLFVASLFLLINLVIHFKKFYEIALVFLILLIQAILFSGFLKWQPWHTRLHIPLFMLSVIFIILIAKKITLFRYILFAFLPILFFSFNFFFLFNNIRPILNNSRLTKTINISDTRFKKYFANQPFLYSDYSIVLNSIYKNNPKKVGLMISNWEYPLFHQYYNDKLQIKSINVGNVTNNINQDTQNIDLIISNKQNEAFILFNGQKYMNQTPKNEYIWLYK